MSWGRRRQRHHYDSDDSEISFESLSSGDDVDDQVEYQSPYRGRQRSKREARYGRSGRGRQQSGPGFLGSFMTRIWSGSGSGSYSKRRRSRNWWSKFLPRTSQGWGLVSFFDLFREHL